MTDYLLTKKASRCGQCLAYSRRKIIAFPIWSMWALRKTSKYLQVEVITFVYMFAYVIRSVSSLSMIIDKVCRVNIGYSDSICDHLASNEIEREKVEIMANNYHLYHSLIATIPSAFLACFIGPWSDKYSRKLPLIVAIVGILIDGVGATLCAVFLRTRVEYYLLPMVFCSMSGGFIAVMGVVYSYVSDLTDPKSRTFKYALMEMALGLALPMGTFAGGYVYKYAGFVPVFGTSVAGHALGLLWVIFVMDETRGLDNKDHWRVKLRTFFSCNSFVESLKATVKPRPHRGRIQIFTMMGAISLYFLSMAGTNSIAYLYTYHRYNWSNTTYSTVSAIFGVVALVVMLISVPLLTRYFKFRDPTLGIIGSLSIVAKSVTIGFADKEYIYYIANAVGVEAGLASLAGRARISKIVSKDDLGKVFTILSTVEFILPVIAAACVSQLYNWSITVSQPGIVYLAVAGLLLLSLFIYIWLACLPFVNYEDEQLKEDYTNQKSNDIQFHSPIDNEGPEKEGKF